MDFKWLKTFIVAAQCENFRQASEQLFLTQPAVTNHIQKLEQSLQCALFIRKGKTVTLSAEGHRFLPIAKTMLAQYDDGLQSFHAWRFGYDKQLTIAVAPQIASSILPAILKSFMQHEPTIDVHLNVVNSYDVVHEVLQGKADVGLTRTELTQASLHYDVALEEAVVLIAPFDTTITDEAQLLKAYRLITHNHPVYWDDLLADVQRAYPTVQTLKVNQVEVTKKFIEQGLGVSYLPHSMVQRELDEQQLKIIPPTRINLPTSKTYTATKVVTPETTAFLQFFNAALRS
ncbi:LysR family transcriptional regulator [Caryophanon latum]|uniref:Transcriptional regulator n=1 Tax=Caryophanon latum TaxID=33977 RepID=A0A1C0YJH2_9BACL|nr:LysR family transcriptional regulator [Caryophanon latum]OCS87284.1 transcriptional regulator [Caryophanon latum]